MPQFAKNPVLLLLPLLLAACGTTPAPQLTRVGAAIPEGISLEGRWELRGDADARASQAAAGNSDRIVLPDHSNRGPRSGRPKDGPSVHVFLETGSNLKITQTGYGLFISFDRSVVEEYRFQEHRRISVGPIDADRVSGWADGRYVIQTLDRQSALLTETYELQDDGRQLVRTVTIVHKEQETLSLQQIFDRLE